ncbi:larval cuticle protein 65Ag1-like [Lycorma delicatula]|uniref:larval cuticle protein 65Ag1-like n=1 Tax=Lycorma delicatula TaxID=130591 RepID=UPI003F513917
MYHMSLFLIGSIIYSTIIITIKGAPQANLATIVSESYQINPDGSYSYSYETSDGKKANEEGVLRDLPNENGTGSEKTIVAKGSYSYTEDGKTYQVDYTADENGFKPSGAHIAPAILAALGNLPTSQVGTNEQKPSQEPPTPPQLLTKLTTTPDNSTTIK